MNLILFCVFTALFSVQMLVLPVLTDNLWAMIAVTVFLIPFNTPFWSLIHEGIHGNLHPNRKANAVMARTMSVLFGAGFSIVRFGHLMHHQYNRDWESEYYDARTDSKWRAALAHYFKMLGGLYLIEVGTSFALALAPGALVKKLKPHLFKDERHREAVSNSLLKPKNIRDLRIDCVAIALLYALSFVLYGPNWIVLCIALTGRALFVSLMDNAFHYDTPPDNSVAAKELALPAPLQKFILNFNHHRTHHHNTSVPWNQLPEESKRQGGGYSEGLFAAIAAQFRGPITQRIDGE